MEEHAQGARPKTYSLRKGTRLDYERMHEGDAKLKKQLADVRDMPAKTPGQSIAVLEGSKSDVGSSKKQGTSLPKTNKQIEALDKEILELQASISKTQSSLKEVSIKKQCRERSNRVAKLRKELFVAEQQLQKAEEEGEPRKHVTLTKSCNSKGFSGKSSHVRDIVSPQNDCEVDLNDLRQNPRLVATVTNQLSTMGLVQSSDSEDSELSNKVLNPEALCQSVKCSKSKKCKSGLYQKSADSVLFPQLWPHTALQYEYVSESVEFMSLDIKMLVAGEIEIVLGTRTPSAEKAGRLKLLRKLMYFANIYEWSALLRFYAAWVRKIEVGLSTWSDDPSEIETPMLARYTLNKNKGINMQVKSSSSRNSEQVWWCPDYNKQQCSAGSSVHQKFIKNQSRTVKHICSSCLKIDKKQLEHPQTSAACPYRK